MNKLASILPARHHEYSMVFSADDDHSRPSDRLLDISIAAIQAARTIELSDLSMRMPAPPYYPDIWPGEHYKLLSALVSVINPMIVIEIGTATGLSALSLKKTLSPEGKIITFDICPYQTVNGAVLREDDFSDGRLIQYTENLEDLGSFIKHREIIGKAELIFIDAAKDGVSESLFIQNLRSVGFQKPPIVVFDDIRLWNMLKIWREITAPKLDLTSFGHWSGTGLVDWVWQ